jgi:long-chain acyl-CoA synthetase
MVSVQMAGGVPVPLYQDAVAEEMAYVLQHCGARYVIVESQEQVDKVLEVQDQLSELKHMVYLDRAACVNTTTRICMHMRRSCKMASEA